MTDQKTEITTSSTNLEETKTDSTNKEEQVKDEEEESVTFIGIKRKRPKNIRKKSEDDQKSPENEQSKNNETNESKDDTKETHTMKKPKIQKGILSMFLLLLPPLFLIKGLLNGISKVTQIFCSFNNERKDSKGGECHVRISIVQNCSSCWTSRSESHCHSGNRS
jgi:cation transport ATPase